MRYRFSPEAVALAAVRELRVDSAMNCDRCRARGLAASSGMPWPRSILPGSGCASSVTIGSSARAASAPRSSARRSAVIDSPPASRGTRTSAVASVHTGTVVLRSSVIISPLFPADPTSGIEGDGPGPRISPCVPARTRTWSRCALLGMAGASDVGSRHRRRSTTSFAAASTAAAGNRAGPPARRGRRAGPAAGGEPPPDGAFQPLWLGKPGWRKIHVPETRTVFPAYFPGVCSRGIPPKYPALPCSLRRP